MITKRYDISMGIRKFEKVKEKKIPNLIHEEIHSAKESEFLFSTIANYYADVSTNLLSDAI